MKVVIQSEQLDPGDNPLWEFPDPVDWYYVNTDGENISRTKDAKRCLVPELEMAEPTRTAIFRRVIEYIAAMADCANSDGRAIIGMRSEMALLSNESPTGYMVCCNLTLAFIPGIFEGEVKHEIFWIPKELTVDDDLWTDLANQITVEEVLLS